VLLIINLEPNRRILYTSYALITFVSAWAVAAIFAAAFQCHLPGPWDFTRGRCINQVEAGHLYRK